MVGDVIASAIVILKNQICTVMLKREAVLCLKNMTVQYDVIIQLIEVTTDIATRDDAIHSYCKWQNGDPITGTGCVCTALAVCLWKDRIWMGDASAGLNSCHTTTIALSLCDVWARYSAPEQCFLCGETLCRFFLLLFMVHYDFVSLVVWTPLQRYIYKLALADYNCALWNCSGKCKVKL